VRIRSANGLGPTIIRVMVFLITIQRRTRRPHAPPRSQTCAIQFDFSSALNRRAPARISAIPASSHSGTPGTIDVSISPWLPVVIRPIFRTQGPSEILLRLLCSKSNTVCLNQLGEEYPSDAFAGLGPLIDTFRRCINRPLSDSFITLVWRSDSRMWYVDGFGSDP